MAEGCAFLYPERLLSDLNMLHGETGKIAYLKKLLALAFAGKEGTLSCVVSEIREQITALHSLLNKIEHDFQENLGKTTSLKELQDTVEKKKNEAHSYLEVLPNGHFAWGSCEFLQNPDHDTRPAETEKQHTKASANPGFPRDTVTVETEDVQEAPPAFGRSKKPSERPQGKEGKPPKACEIPAFSQKILPVTLEDLEELPVYMKGRITCDQINAVVNNLNKAMMAKYRIRCQAPSSLNTRDRTLYYRYIREESETREGCPFIVEEDIRLFTSMKMDKRFYQIITVLRHFRRLKVIRTSGIILYAMC
ncbi:spindle and kinetochore-associated protein 1-like [Lathamus discolor]|uniref:spindle and kinetochore-associated protein 1-like n=1 Tax=Lathamus discolor TaxID=678569 RepID=UPI0032B76927